MAAPIQVVHRRGREREDDICPGRRCNHCSALLDIRLSRRVFQPLFSLPKSVCQVRIDPERTLSLKKKVEVK